MADYENKKIEGEVGEEIEAKDRGLFDFLGNKKEEEKPQSAEEVIVVTEQFEKVEVSEPKVEEEHEKKPTLLEKLHRSDSSSSSVSFDFTFFF